MKIFVFTAICVLSFYSNILRAVPSSDADLLDDVSCETGTEKQLSDGVMFCKAIYQNEVGETDKYNVVVVDRSKPYRIRPIVDFTSKNSNGRFKTHSVKKHIDLKGGHIVIAAINGDGFENDDGTKNVYEDGKLTFPGRNMFFGGVDIRVNLQKIQALLTFSSNSDQLGIDQLFYKVDDIALSHDFQKIYIDDIGLDEFNKSSTSFINNKNFTGLGKTKVKSSVLDWAIGLTQGSILGNVYVKNPVTNKNMWVTKECFKPDNTPDDFLGFGTSDYVPVIAFNAQQLVLAVSTTEVAKNKHACEFFKTLKMDYAAYLDGGESTQMVIHNSNPKLGEETYIDKSPNGHNRAVLSSLAIVKAYPDVTSLSDEYKEAIYYLTDFGIFSGYDKDFSQNGVLHKKGDFGPYNTITRAEVSKVLVRIIETIILKSPKRADLHGSYELNDLFIPVYVNKDRYTDVKSTDWFSKYVSVMVGEGIAKGRTKTEFSPNGSITIPELAKMIAVTFTGDVIKMTTKGEWFDRYFNCVSNNGKGYKNRFGETVDIFNNKSNSAHKDEYATRKDVALFLYRALITWQDDNFSDACADRLEI